MLKQAIVFFLLPFFLFAGDVEVGTTMPLPLSFENTTEVQRQLLQDYYQKDAEPFSWSLEKIQSKQHYTLYQLKFPSSNGIETTQCRYWVPKLKSSPAVIVPHLEGGFAGVEAMCQKLASEGLCVLMVNYSLFNSSNNSQPLIEGIRDAVLNISYAKDWLQTRSEVKTEQIGIFGISIGAMVGCVAAGVDSQFKQKAFVLGGGDLAHIFLHESTLTKQIVPLIFEANMSKEKLREILLPVEPLTFASRLDAKKTMMINAKKDSFIPRACALRLAKAIGIKNIHWTKEGHQQLILSYPIYIKVCAHHLKK